MKNLNIMLEDELLTPLSDPVPRGRQKQFLISNSYQSAASSTCGRKERKFLSVIWGQEGRHCRWVTQARRYEMNRFFQTFAVIGWIFCVVQTCPADILGVTVQGPGGTGSATFAGDTANIQEDFTSLGYINDTIQVGSDEVITLNKYIINATGDTWTDFELTLSGGATITEAYSITRFDQWSTLPASALTFWDGTVSSDSDDVLNMDLVLNFPNPGTYVMTEYPTIPEPATFTLLCSALAGLGGAVYLRRAALALTTSAGFRRRSEPAGKIKASLVP